MVAATVVVLGHDRQSAPASVAYEEPGQQACGGGLALGEQVPVPARRSIALTIPLIALMAGSSSPNALIIVSNVHRFRGG